MIIAYITNSKDQTFDFTKQDWEKAQTDLGELQSSELLH